MKGLAIATCVLFALVSVGAPARAVYPVDKHTWVESTCTGTSPYYVCGLGVEQSVWWDGSCTGWPVFTSCKIFQWCKVDAYGEYPMTADLSCSGATSGSDSCSLRVRAETPILGVNCLADVSQYSWVPAGTCVTYSATGTLRLSSVVLDTATPGAIAMCVSGSGVT